MRVGLIVPPYVEEVGGGFTFIDMILKTIKSREFQVDIVILTYDSLNEALLESASKLRAGAAARTVERERLAAEKNRLSLQAQRALAEAMSSAAAHSVTILKSQSPPGVIERLKQRFAAPVEGPKPVSFMTGATPPNSVRLPAEVVVPETREEVTSSIDEVLNARIEQLDIDLVWFLAPYKVVRVDIPYMITVWDLAHRILPFFPEVSIHGWTWAEREEYYREMLPRASFILVGTQQGAMEVSRCYDVPHDRIRIVPLPAPSFAESHGKRDLPTARPYLYYPANFWPHKNHVRAMEALRIIRDDYGLDLDLVFTGSDQGNQNFMKEACPPSCRDNIHFLGFIDRDFVGDLYRGAEALLYLSFFGPDNLPPLEAFACGCPVIVSDHPGHREQLDDAALFVDPLDPRAIADGVCALMRDPALRSRLLERGREIATTRTVDAYADALDKIWIEFDLYRQCWADGT